MKIYQSKWWKSLFKPATVKKFNSEQDILAVIEFLESVQSDVKTLLPELNALLELEQECKVATSGIVQVNINTQAKILDKILERFEFFASDAAITGIRIKNICGNLLTEAKHQGMEDLVDQKEQDPKWQR